MPFRTAWYLVVLFSTFCSSPLPAMDIETCRKALQSLQQNPDLHRELRKIVYNDQHKLSQDNARKLQELGLVNPDGCIEDSTHRNIVAIEFNNDPPPRTPDRIVAPVDEKTLKEQLDLKSGLGYGFYDSSALIPPELQSALAELNPRAVDHLQIKNGKVVWYDPKFSLPRHLDVYPYSAEAKEWIKRNTEHAKVVEKYLPVLVERTREKVLSVLDPEEAKNLEISNVYVRSNLEPMVIGRHTDKLYLRASVALKNQPTWIWDPVQKQVISAKENWTVLFSGRDRAPAPATEHYGPRDRNKERRDTLFIDFDPISPRK